MSKDDISQTYHAGHRAWDIYERTPLVHTYGIALCAPEDCLVLGINGDTFTPNEHKRLENGYGIRLKGLETGLEYLYWHCLPTFPVWGGQRVNRGQIVAYMGNAGNVYAGGKYVPLDKRLEEPKLGTHVHFVVFDKDGNQIDPAPLFNWSWQPQYSYLDLLKAFIVVLQKQIKLYGEI